MNAELLVNRVLDDEGLAGDLEGSAAEALVGWAVKQAEQIAARVKTGKDGLKQVEAMCRQARAIARVSAALCHQKDEAAAAALAKKDGLPWPVADAATADKAVAWLTSHAPAVA